MTLGASVLVTRPPCDRASLTHLLESAGYSPVSVPLYERHWRVDEIIHAAQAHPQVGHLILSDPTCAEVLALAAPKTWGAVPVTALGEATSARAQQLGFRVQRTVTQQDAGAPHLNADSLGDSTLAVLCPAHPLSARRSYEHMARTVVTVEAYERVSPSDLQARLSEALPVTATVLCDATEAHLTASLASSLDGAGLGHILCANLDAAEAARKAGLTVHSVAQAPTARGVVRTLRALYPISVS